MQYTYYYFTYVISAHYKLQIRVSMNSFYYNLLCLTINRRHYWSWHFHLFYKYEITLNRFDKVISHYYFKMRNMRLLIEALGKILRSRQNDRVKSFHKSFASDKNSVAIMKQMFENYMYTSQLLVAQSVPVESLRYNSRPRRLCLSLNFYRPISPPMHGVNERNFKQKNLIILLFISALLKVTLIIVA